MAMFEERSLQRRRRGNRWPLTIVAATAAVVMGLVLFPWAPRAQVASTPTVTAITPAAADPNIRVHGGGTRVDDTTTVNPLPMGTVFRAASTDSTDQDTCTTPSASTNNCTIMNLPDGHQWDVALTGAPTGYYLNQRLSINNG